MKPSHKNRIAMMAALFFFASGKISAQTAHLVLHEGAIPGNTRNYDISYSPSDSNIFEAYQSSNIPSGEVTTLTFDLGGLGNLQYPPKPFTSIWFSTTKLGIPLALGSFTDAMHAPYESPGHPGFDIQFGDRGNFLAQGSFTISEISYLPNGKIASFDASFEAHSMPLDDGSIIDRYEGTFSYQAVPEPGTLPLLTLGIFFIFLCKKYKASAQRKLSYALHGQ